jgi:hypothetical protein
MKAENIWERNINEPSDTLLEKQACSLQMLIA